LRHPKTSYVKTIKKGSHALYYVRAVPKDLQAAVGKTKWTIPLDSANRANALFKARAIALEHDALIERLRRPDPLETMSEPDRRRVDDVGGVEAFMARQRERWHGANLAANVAEMARNYPRGMTEAEAEELERELAALPESEAAKLKSKAAILETKLATRPRTESSQTEIDPAFAESEAAAFEATARVLDSAITADAPILNQLGVDLPSRLRTEAPEVEPRTFSDLCEKYLTTRNPRNKGAYRNVAKAFENQNGNLALKDITKAHVRTYRDWLPSTGNEESTSKGCFKKLKTMFIFGAEDDYLKENPAATLPWSWPHTQSVAEADDKARRTFTHEEADRYLKAAGKLPLNDRTRWFILLMMYSGARGEEIAQLAPEDVKQISGVWCLSIHDREWRTLKTDSSLRDVPIHKVILDHGFLEFATSRKGKQLLFSNRHATKETRCYPRNAEDVRAVLRTQALVKDNRAVPYSSRHTVKDCLRLVECPRYVEDRILGHTAPANKVADGYGEAQILVLKKWVDQIDPLDKRRTTTIFTDVED
jgi:integrase